MFKVWSGWPARLGRGCGGRARAASLACCPCGIARLRPASRLCQLRAPWRPAAAASRPGRSPPVRQWSTWGPWRPEEGRVHRSSLQARRQADAGRGRARAQTCACSGTRRATTWRCRWTASPRRASPRTPRSSSSPSRSATSRWRRAAPRPRPPPLACLLRVAARSWTQGAAGRAF